MSKTKKMSSILDRLSQMFETFGQELDGVKQEMSYIRGKLDEQNRHNGKLVEAYKKQVADQQKLMKWFMAIIVALLIIIGALLNVDLSKVLSI